MSTTHGENLVALCEDAHERAFLAAPFIKEKVLTKLFQAIPEHVKITVVTRWIPEEVAHGASDLEVFDIVTQRPNAELFLHPCLHAKYYCVDSRCLIGSANLTLKALGWCSIPNIEVLTEVSPHEHGLYELEQIRLSQSVIATESIKNSVAQAASAIRTRNLGDRTQEEEIEENNHAVAWLPTCTSPEHLFKLYSKADTSKMLTSAVETGKQDLSDLAIIPGLSENDFRRYIAAILEQTPSVQEIFSTSKNSGITPEIATSILNQVIQEIPHPFYDDPEDYWLALKKWLLYFFPDRFRVRAAVEVLEQARELP